MLKKVTDSLSSLLTVLQSFFSDCRPGSVCDFINNVGDTNYFESFSDNITLTTMQSLERQAEWLKKYNTPNMLIEGHCDPDEGTYEYCLALGERRAQAAKNYMSKFYDPKKIEIISYGKSRPITNLTSDYRNRRIVTIIR